jgi:lysine 2,3-aminomutase
MKLLLNEENDEPPPLQTEGDSASASVLAPVSAISPLTHSSKLQTIQNRNNTLIDKYTKVPARRLILTRSTSDFVISPAVDEFRMRFYPEATEQQWNDWRWQLRNRVKDLPTLERLFTLSEYEREAISAHTGPLPSSVSPYYASLVHPVDADQPLRRTVVMVSKENEISPFEAADPLDEDGDSPVPGLVHRYPDRVLFLVTGFCAVYCRYCTRSRMVGNQGGEYRFSLTQWENALAYITAHSEIRDVLLSGGDPLTLADEKLDWLLSKLRKIPHVEFIRIGTKVPAVLPQRITAGLIRTLRRYHPLWMSIHFSHPDELTPEVAQACGKLADAGIPLGSQTVLLKGVNDNVETMKRLFQGLLKIRVKPYYLYQCDPVAGTSHFRTTVEKGLEIISGLRGYTTGYAVPTFVIDAPGGGGKVPLLPDNVAGRDGDYILLKNYKGDIYRYPDPAV